MYQIKGVDHSEVCSIYRYRAFALYNVQFTRKSLTLILLCV